MVDRLIETEYDIGLSAGRNRLVEAAQNSDGDLLDDDHVVGPQTRLNDLVRKFDSSRLDLLATLSKQPHRPHPDGTPGYSIPQAACLHIPRGESIDASVTLPSAHSFVIALLPIETSCRPFDGMKTSKSMSTGTSSGEPRLPASGSVWRWTTYFRTSTSILSLPATSTSVLGGCTS